MPQHEPLNGNAALQPEEVDFVLEGLKLLLQDKERALKSIQDSGLTPGGRNYLPRDFGIPQIQALIGRLEPSV